MTNSPSQFEADIPLPRLRTISQLWSCAALLGAIGVAALAVDVPLATWIRGGNCPGAIQKLFAVSEVFGHGLGVVFVVLIIGVLDPWHRYAIPRILAAAFGSGLLANVFKLLVARARPYSFDLHGSGLDTFSQWFPLLGSGPAQQSFPSSHTATAAGLAIVLAYFYPRGRWLFPAFAILAGGERLVDQFHFLSDTFWGAAVGCIFAPLCVYGSSLSRGFDRLEQQLLNRAGVTSASLRRIARARAANADADLPRAA
ncbi:MAG: phosphatase PAP2 family protein [Planctomycetia bacterium]|nr:phosphatase PAP2 family protein [Planctomycetia bacterium]